MRGPPASPIIPALTRYPGVGGLLIPMRKADNSYQRSVIRKREEHAFKRPPVTSHQTQLTSPFLLPTGRWAPATGGLSSPLSLSSHSPPRLLRHPLPERNLLVSPLFQGARPAGMSPLYRCPDAHD